MVREREGFQLSGIPMLLFLVGAEGLGVVVFAGAIKGGEHALAVVMAVVIALVAFSFAGFFIVNPNEAKILQIFGNYAGSVRADGLRWTNPFATKRGVSLRAQSFESSRLKVNDLRGNPIEIGTVIVWRVVDAAKATFEVAACSEFVHKQCESAIRHLASSYPYDSHDDGTESLRGSGGALIEHLKREIQGHVALAGVEIIDARISHLAYAQEIAHAMLQRQQAEAVLAARQIIVEGAVGMVELALKRLEAHGVVKLDEERRAAMVSNLLVVLCGSREAQPVVNTGTLYT